MNITRHFALVIFLAGSTIAIADPQPGDTLKGPKVPDRAVPGVDNGLGEGKERGKGNVAREVAIPQRLFMQMLNESCGPNAHENLRLSDTQRTQIESINNEFMDKQRAFMESHREEITKLMKEHPEVARMMRENGFPLPPGVGERGQGKGRPNGEKRPGKGPENRPEGTPPPPGDEMNPEAKKPQPPAPLDEKGRKALMEKLEALKAEAPKQEDTRTAIWALLNKDQQAAVQTKVDAHKAEREKQMDERYKERQKKQFEENKDKGAKLTDATREEILKSLSDEDRARIKNLPPEAQERVLRRLAEVPADQRAKAIEEIKQRLQERGKGKPESK